MKVVAIALCLVCACSKPDDVPVLRDEARSLSIYYEAQLEALARRKTELIDRTPSALQPAAGQLLSGATARIQNTRELVDHHAGGKSKLEHTADDMTDPDALKALVDNQRSSLAATMEAIRRELDFAERQLGHMTPAEPHD